jgi:hypothetical protein
MAKKAVKIEVEEVGPKSFGPSEGAEIGSSGPVPVIPTPAISHVSIDFGREDLNTLGKKVNEIIDYLAQK